MPRDSAQHAPIPLISGTYTAQEHLIPDLISLVDLSDTDRQAISSHAADIVTRIRASATPGLMEVFLAEYGLSTQEGIALMCLAEALLRVPDADTIDALIEDKIAPSDWGKHMGHSTSPLVNASTWALMLTGKVLQNESPGIVSHLKGAVKRLGEPVIRTAVARAMKEMGRQFVLGETITSAMTRAKKREAQGYTYSYDMLGEAARTESDAVRYHLAYSRAITAIADASIHDDIRENPGISVKLSALHPRYEYAKHERVMAELVPRLRSLALLAKAAKIGLNIDAEESDRLEISLAVIDAVLSEPALAGWDGFGVVVQAYGKRASATIDYLYDIAARYDRKIMVRLVKGAYWDTEIKRAQVMGLSDFPVFTDKAVTDLSYMANARKLLGMTDRIYPQFATHNAHTVAAILHMANDRDVFEFQRLHGMGETLHDLIKTDAKTRCRIYAPVGAHRDLLAYLVRRLLENGANSSFVNQIVDTTVPADVVARDPLNHLSTERRIKTGPELFAPERQNSQGYDLTHTPTLASLEQARASFVHHTWSGAPILTQTCEMVLVHPVLNPADPTDTVGHVQWATPEQTNIALETAQPWSDKAQTRAQILNRAADLYETHFGELFALLCREAGKSVPDAIAELREAVDFLRYYATQAADHTPAGIFCCISPWNFPMAIFTGQIAAALAAGNGVIAKPAEQTPLIACRLVELLHLSGVPISALQILPGDGSVGAALTQSAQINGVAFTGSTQTAQLIRKSMADHMDPGAPFIAETGGLNAMIIDSTALPEQAIGAIVESAFQSAGQRCSALRCVYVQSDIAPEFIKMLKGAMNELSLGNPWYLSTDIGPVIDQEAQSAITDYIAHAREHGRVLHERPCPKAGHFVAPTLIQVGGIQDLEREVFGPVLHVATFESNQIDQIVTDINATGYGLTFGLQTRIDDRVQDICEKISAGNIYVNRNQIGAIVGSQPFGGEGLSGTGPKAGGPRYLNRFWINPHDVIDDAWTQTMDRSKMDALLGQTGHSPALSRQTLPGPTGESNQLATYAKPAILCAGPGQRAAEQQAQAIRALGGVAVVATGTIPPEWLETCPDFGGLLWWGNAATARTLAQALAKRTGPIIPLITSTPDSAHAIFERHTCIDTTAAGGNAALLAGAS